MLLNIANHGDGERMPQIEVTLASKPAAVTIDVIDDGRAFDPLHDVAPPDVDAPLQERPAGGLGLHLTLITHRQP